MRLLLAEDDAMIGESVQRGLRQDGFAVDWVRDGREAEIALAEALRLIDEIRPKAVMIENVRGFLSAVFEDYHHVSPAFRPLYLAAGTGWLRGSGERDTKLFKRARAARLRSPPLSFFTSVVMRSSAKRKRCDEA